MAIIKFTKSYTSPDFALLNRYPDQFVDDKRKQDTDWWKINMDYWYNVAIQQYNYNKQRIVPNYELVKGKIRRSDFYNQPPEVQSFTSTLLKDEELPSYVRHYSIMTPVLNDLNGELSKRPDNVYVKAFDSDSQSEELNFRTEVCQKLIMDIVKKKILTDAAAEGTQLEDDEVDQMTAEKAQEQLGSYTTLGERWGSRVLEFMKMRFNMKEKSETAFRHLMISARQYFHIYEDNSPLGFNIEILNPKNTWVLSTADEKYTADPLDKNHGCYAAGTIQIMEFSEIINKFKLTKEEIEHMKELSQQGYLLSTRKSNLVSPVTKTDWRSVEYDVYDPAVLQYRRVLESELLNNRDELTDLLGITSAASTFGSKFLVVTAYWNSKKKMGKLTYIDEDGIVQTTMVDENYKKGTHPKEISLEWGWINQWYQGTKIGLDIYYVKPVEILDYCPIIGVVYEPENIANPPSLVDQMKPFQMLYNVAMNKLFRLLEKDLGVVFLTSIRQVPVPKDGDYQDAIEMWETEAREKGIIFIDDAPDNMKAQSSFNQHKAVDLSRSNEIQAMYNLAVQMRTECWKLVGISEQRLGESRATETATGINSALTQSYAQTEPLFAQHEYTLNKVYQALLDAALYVESNKPMSTISYITSEGEHAFVQINGSDLKMKELGVFVTSRAEDAMNFKEFRQLAQAMLQNGASPYEVSLLYGTKSIRRMQQIFKKLKDQQDQFQQQQQQIEQQKLEQQQQQFEQAQQLAQLQHEKDQAFEAFQNEQDRISKEKIAAMVAAAKAGGEDLNANGLPDVLEVSKFNLELEKAQKDYQTKVQDLTQKQSQILQQQAMNAQNADLQREKLKMEKYKVDQQVKIAKMNKNKPAKK